jgi:type I restriction enzyme S subunit
LIPKNNFNRDFIYYLLCNNFDFGEKGGVIKHIYFSVYCKNKIKVPNIREQQKIADFLSTIDDLETILKNQLEQIELMKQYYLDKLFPKKDSNVPEIRFKRFSGE